MLVLSRKKGQSIKIADNIYIKYLNRDHNTVYIGIDAPQEINIVRTELLEDHGNLKINTIEQGEQHDEQTA